jgi:cob(I)alamin adenosyltransferase
METKEKRYKWRRENYRENTKGLLMVNTGDGKGKTTAALGVLVRAAGRGMNCCLIQFMKSKNDRYGEHQSLETLGVEVHTMGDGFTWDTKNPEQDIKTSEKTWALCVEKMRSEEYDLLVFDELVYEQPHLHIIVTGRNAPEKLIEAADLVTEMKEIKHPFHAGIYAQQGIEF